MKLKLFLPFFLFFGIIMAVVPVFAQSTVEDFVPGVTDTQSGKQTSNTSVSFPNPLAANDITDLVNTIATWLLGIGATIAVIMVLWAAFLFMTSGGSEKKVTQARQTLWYAIIGLTVLLLAKGVALFIQNVLSGRF